MKMSKLDAIIQRVLKISDASILDDLRLGEISSWDSMSHMELIVSIETEFDVQFDGDEIAEMTSVQAIRKAVADKQG